MVLSKIELKYVISIEFFGNKKKINFKIVFITKYVKKIELSQ